jgi:hypothetical protein
VIREFALSKKKDLAKFRGKSVHDATGSSARALAIESTGQDRFHEQLQSFGYREDRSCSTATPSMPVGLPLTLGTLAQISFSYRFHFRLKKSPRAGCTLKVSPTAKNSI